MLEIHLCILHTHTHTHTLRERERERGRGRGRGRGQAKYVFMLKIDRYHLLILYIGQLGSIHYFQTFFGITMLPPGGQICETELKIVEAIEKEAKLHLGMEKKRKQEIEREEKDVDQSEEKA